MKSPKEKTVKLEIFTRNIILGAKKMEGGSDKQGRVVNFWEMK